jgi:hypothetical protein
MISDRLLVDDAYYWLNAPAIDSDDPVMIGSTPSPVIVGTSVVNSTMVVWASKQFDAFTNRRSKVGNGG